MKVLVEKKLLVVGLESLAEKLMELPARIKFVESGTEAVSSFKNEKFDGVISRWNLKDMADGKLLRGIKLIKPTLPVVSVVNSGSIDEEISSRTAGVNAVVTDKSSDILLSDIVCRIFKMTVPSKAHSSVKTK
jgi:DNA-binding NtrC family response regulator